MKSETPSCFLCQAKDTIVFNCNGAPARCTACGHAFEREEIPFLYDDGLDWYEDVESENESALFLDSDDDGSGLHGSQR